MAPGGKARFSIDRGGTFTDIVCEYPVLLDPLDDEIKEQNPYQYACGQHIRALKLLSVNPDCYPDAPREGIRRLLEAITGQTNPIDAPLRTSQIESIRMGTTIATNALLERKG
jgi:5-oxoprolinase (ATP-hydrolysing)